MAQSKHSIGGGTSLLNVSSRVSSNLRVSSPYLIRIIGSLHVYLSEMVLSTRSNIGSSSVDISEEQVVVVVCIGVGIVIDKRESEEVSSVFSWNDLGVLVSTIAKGLLNENKRGLGCLNVQEREYVGIICKLTLSVG
jgi:hypothetical protein